MITARINILLIIGGLFICNKAFMQNVGIGTETPLQKLDVNGGIRIGTTDITNAGAIRWNEIKNDFEGYNGAAWVSLTSGKGMWGNQASYATENFCSQFTLQYGDLSGSELGNAMAGTGEWIAIGAYRDGAPNNETLWHTGSVRIMKREGDQWKLKHSAYDPNPSNSDFFGYSVDLSTSHMISGTPYADLPNSGEQGKAYIYTYDNNAIALQATLLASDGQALDLFGTAVAIDGEYAAVGASGNDILGLTNMGRVYIYKKSGTTWPQYQVLTPSDGAMDDHYGGAVAMWGEYLAIAAPLKSYNGFTGAGKVYIYKKNVTSWSLIQQINSPSPNTGERFGIQLAIKDNVLLVGASDYSGNIDDGNGSVYIYAIDNNSLTYQAVVTASDGVSGNAFGASVAYLDGVILVGAPYAAVGGSNKHGKAYVYRMLNGAWEEESILTASTDESYIYFGTSVALVPDFGIVSAPFADLPNRPDNGQVFFFKQH